MVKTVALEKLFAWCSSAGAQNKAATKTQAMANALAPATVNPFAIDLCSR